MNLATDDRVARYCRQWAARHATFDCEDVAAEGILGVLAEPEPVAGPPIARAILAARAAMRKRVVSESRDRKRQALYAQWRATRPRSPSRDDRIDAGAIVAMLSGRQQTALWLGYGLDWSWESVGLVMGCSRGAALMLADRAIRMTRKKMGIAGKRPRKRQVRR